MPKIEFTQEKIEQALKACCIEEPAETDPCQGCYLYRLRDDSGHMSTGQSCFEYLAYDIIDYIRRINDFEHSQAAKLLADNGVKARRITELEKALENMAWDLQEQYGHSDAESSTAERYAIRARKEIEHELEKRS